MLVYQQKPHTKPQNPLSNLSQQTFSQLFSSFFFFRWFLQKAQFGCNFVPAGAPGPPPGNGGPGPRPPDLPLRGGGGGIGGASPSVSPLCLQRIGGAGLFWLEEKSGDVFFLKTKNLEVGKTSMIVSSPT